jgi:hypothetical protein
LYQLHLQASLPTLPRRISEFKRQNCFLALLSALQRKEGVDMNTIIRLTKFHELNVCAMF